MYLPRNRIQIFRTSEWKINDTQKPSGLFTDELHSNHANLILLNPSLSNDLLIPYQVHLVDSL